MNRHIKKMISIFKYNRKKINRLFKNIDSIEDKEYIVFYNPECIGIMNSIKELFGEDRSVALYEIFNKREINDLAFKIKENGFKQIIFATMAYGYKPLCETIYNLDNNIKIKFLWHGSHSLFVNRDEEYFLYNILDLNKRNIVKSIGFLKSSMAEFYKLKGYNTCFVKNTVSSIDFKENEIKSSNNIKIGLYAAGDRWEKNTYNQLSACSMIENAVVDILPNTKLSKSFSKLMGIKLYSDKLTNSVSREELFKRMASNDINLYVTFTECAPMIPLESFELGVPCIIGNNTSYFENSTLEDYLVVKEEDSIDEIYDKIKKCLSNKVEIMELYKEWKQQYDKNSKKSVEEFLKI